MKRQIESLIKEKKKNYRNYVKKVQNKTDSMSVYCAETICTSASCFDSFCIHHT